MSFVVRQAVINAKHVTAAILLTLAALSAAGTAQATPSPGLDPVGGGDVEFQSTPISSPYSDRYSSVSYEADRDLHFSSTNYRV
ncbi:hypothetical protein ABZ471_38365 [Streptomyces sp. NPDC005728]|uniref:hypothetical protein n=1 Tax=Streptomyces sp. NPDC005728 TaxID=3157054 RepID=UPI0033DED6D7